MLHHLLLVHLLVEVLVVPMARAALTKSPTVHAEDPSQRKPPTTLPTTTLPQPTRTRRTSLSKMMKRSLNLAQFAPRTHIAVVNVKSQLSSTWMPIHSRCTSCNKCKYKD